MVHVPGLDHGCFWGHGSCWWRKVEISGASRADGKKRKGCALLVLVAQTVSVRSDAVQHPAHSAQVGIDVHLCPCTTHSAFKLVNDTRPLM